jgi:hypothetical protein
MRQCSSAGLALLPPRLRCQQLIARTTAAAVMKAAKTVCGKVTSCVELVSSAQMLVSSARPVSGLKAQPTGCCIQELAARMKYALPTVPAASSQMLARCSRADSRSRPKTHRPRKVDSRKKATRPSMASGAPKTSPTKRE